MKKGIIVLLIAVLVAGFAFADGKAGDVTFTGNAKIGYEFDLQNKDHGIINSNGTKFSFKFEFATAEGSSKGDGKVYAEIAATADVTLEFDENDTDGIVLTAEITKANIVAGDLTIDILGPKGAFDYAKSYVLNADKKTAWKDLANGYKIKDHGFVATYKDFSLALAYYHDELLPPIVDAHEDDLYIGVQTPAFKLADGMTIQGGANFRLCAVDDYDFSYLNAGGGFKFAYAPEESKLSASFAADAAVEKISEVDPFIPVDIAAMAKYDFVQVDVYFGTENKFEEGSNYLAGRVKVDYKVNDQITAGARAEAIFDGLGDDDMPILAFGANVKYTADKLGAYAGVVVTMLKGADGYELAPWKEYQFDYAGLGIECGVSTKALINNATVALDYKGADFAKAGDDPINLGKITASVTVAF